MTLSTKIIIPAIAAFAVSGDARTVPNVSPPSGAAETVTLTLTQITTLQNDIANNNIPAFYSHLEDYRDSYGRLGKGTTSNDSWQGMFSNEFAKYGAKDNGIDLTYGSPEWASLNRDLADRYLSTYIENNGTTPTRSQIQKIHNEAFINAGLDPNDWFPNKLLNDSANPDDLWSDLITNDSQIDLWGDAFDVMQAGGYFSLLYAYETPANRNETDPVQSRFAKNLLHALANIDKSALGNMLADFTVGPILFKKLPHDPLSSVQNLLGSWISALQEQSPENQNKPNVLLSMNGCNVAHFYNVGIQDFNAPPYYNHNAFCPANPRP